jgi:hypothetical protein
VKIALLVLAVIAVLGIAAMLVFVYVVQSVEQPAYRLVEQDGAFEVRDYPPLVVAQVRGQGTRKEALGAGFGPLARYIFAKERAGERISMTAPVIQQHSGQNLGPIAMTAPVTQTRREDGDWAVSFIMPSRYRLDQLPAPAGGKVHLSTIPARRAAAVRFDGRADDAALADNEARLRAWMAGRGLTAADAAPVFAYYNDPLTPGPLRRNEVIIDLAGRPAAEAAP